MEATGWRYARWGMSADEIVAASEGAARKVEDAECEDQSGEDFTTLAVAEIAIDPFEFDVSFRAPRNGITLTSVRLALRDPDQYEPLCAALSAEHGPGERLPSDPDQAIERVQWSTTGGVVVLKRLTWPMDLGVDVVIDYEAEGRSGTPT